MPANAAPTPGPERFLYWLGLTCRAARQDNRIKMREIVALAHLDASSLYRFEAGASWPEHVERVVTAYAQCAELDPRMVWLAACQWWLRDGSAPHVHASGTVIAAKDEIPESVLSGLEQALSAYARETEQEASRSAVGPHAISTRAASSTRARP